jgi:hypothetical protein
MRTRKRDSWRETLVGRFEEKSRNLVKRFWDAPVHDGIQRIIDDVVDKGTQLGLDMSTTRALDPSPISTYGDHVLGLWYPVFHSLPWGDEKKQALWLSLGFVNQEFLDEMKAMSRTFAVATVQLNALVHKLPSYSHLIELLPGLRVITAPAALRTFRRRPRCLATITIHPDLARAVTLLSTNSTTRTNDEASSV